MERPETPLGKNAPRVEASSDPSGESISALMSRAPGSDPQLTGFSGSSVDRTFSLWSPASPQEPWEEWESQKGGGG